MAYLLRGNTEECLADFAQRFSRPEARSLLAAFTGADEHSTVYRWLERKVLPKGEPLIRVRCFLTLIGYQVDGFSELPEVTKSLAMLIALSIIRAGEARDALSYTNTDAIYQIILRQGGLYPQRQWKLNRLVEEHRQAADEAQIQWLKRMEEFKAQATAQPAVDAREPAPTLFGTRESESRQATDTGSSVRASIKPSAVGNRVSQEQSDDICVAQAVAHLLYALDSLIRGSGQMDDLIGMVGIRVSPRRLRTIKAYLDDLLQSK